MRVKGILTVNEIRKHWLKMRCVYVLLTIITARAAVSLTSGSIEGRWEDHLQRFAPAFPDEDGRERAWNAFVLNDAIIQKHNADEAHTFTLAHNKWSLLTYEEFESHMLSSEFDGWGVDVVERKREKGATRTQKDVDVDWSVDGGGGAVSVVKDQGMCGSCWAFSTVGSMEGAYAIANDMTPIDLSVQQLVSCDGGNSGCAGGWIPSAFDYVAENSLCLSEDYPYVSANITDGHAPVCDVGNGCAAEGSLFNLTSVMVEHSEEGLKEAVGARPVSVAVCANVFWQFYNDGVLSHVNSTCHNHGVLVVGFGNEARGGGDFWKIKNSWGADWGEFGFIRVARNVPDISQEDGPCGMLTFAIYPELA